MSQYLKPDPQKLRDTIKHIVVLMLENRSFDNLLGWLYADERPPDGQCFEGLTRDLWNPLENIDDDGVPFFEKVPIARNGEPKTLHGRPLPNPVRFTLPDPDPGEGFKDTNHQLFLKYDVPLQYPPEPTNMGFVQNYQNAMVYGTYSFGDAPSDPRAIMACYTPEQTPVLSALARGFAVCDHYHCSVPSQTIPNRDFVHAATSTGHVNNGPIATCDARTIYKQIQDAIDAGRTDLSWGVFGSNPLTSSKDASGRTPGNHFSLTRLIMTRLHDPRFDGNFGTQDDFAAKCRAGALPGYSFLEPNYGGAGQNDQHPSADIRPGEQLIADVYNLIKASPAFEQTLLVITYDEHGVLRPRAPARRCQESRSRQPARTAGVPVQPLRRAGPVRAGESLGPARTHRAARRLHALRSHVDHQDGADVLRTRRAADRARQGRARLLVRPHARHAAPRRPAHGHPARLEYAGRGGVAQRPAPCDG
jgi:phospholipase C